jgi:hypothetical protein
MNISKGKSRRRRLLDAVRGVVPGMRSGGRHGLTSSTVFEEAKRQTKDLQKHLPEKPVRVAGLMVGGLAGLTAGSAGISSRRRRDREARSHS